jgi:hypothetical protein
LARLARDTAQVDRAGFLWGAVEAAEATRPELAWAVGRPGWEAAVVRNGGREFDDAREHGRRLSLDEAVAYVPHAEREPVRA